MNYIPTFLAGSGILLISFWVIIKNILNLSNVSYPLNYNQELSTDQKKFLSLKYLSKIAFALLGFGLGIYLVFIFFGVTFQGKIKNFPISALFLSLILLSFIIFLFFNNLIKSVCAILIFGVTLRFIIDSLEVTFPDWKIIYYISVLFLFIVFSFFNKFFSPTIKSPPPLTIYKMKKQGIELKKEKPIFVTTELIKQRKEIAKKEFLKWLKPSFGFFIFLLLITSTDVFTQNLDKVVKTLSIYLIIGPIFFAALLTFRTVDYNK